jgi:hypothetical protein
VIKTLFSIIYLSSEDYQGKECQKESQGLGVGVNKALFNIIGLIKNTSCART